MIAKYTQYDTHGLHINNDVLFPLSFGCLDKLRKWATPCAANKWALEEPTDTKIPNEELDYLCWIGLQILSNADDGSTVRKSGQDILNWVSRRGYARAKDYLKFGTGNIGKEYTYQKTPKFEAIANDIDCLIEFKVKEEDAESYGGMLDFLVKLLKQGFPADHQIKINSKLKNYIPVDGLNKKSKTNLFFGNASTFTELWGKMAEYVRTVFDPYTYHSDSSEDEAVTVGGYAVYALGVRDMAANLEIVKEFMSNVDLEHDCTAKAFAQEYMNK